MNTEDGKFNDVLNFVVRARKIGGVGLLEIGMFDAEGVMETSSCALLEDIERILPYLVVGHTYSAEYHGLEAAVSESGQPAIFWVAEFDLDAARNDDLVAHLTGENAEEWKQFGYTIGETLLCDITNGKPKLKVVENA